MTHCLFIQYHPLVKHTSDEDYKLIYNLESLAESGQEFECGVQILSNVWYGVCVNICILGIFFSTQCV